MSKGLARVVLAVSAFYGCTWSGDPPTGQATSGAGTPLPLSWTVSTWFVDPANSTGTANDASTNSCTSADQPCLTYAGIVSRWGGTYSPRLRQDTSITFLSSHSDDTDPVYFSPFVEHGATAWIQGALGTAQQVPNGSGSLSVVGGKNRVSGQLLEVTLPTGAAPGQLVVNGSMQHPGRAWVYKNAGGSNWFLSQPMAPFVVPGTRDASEVDAWAEGDPIALYNPVAVNIAQAAPTIVDATNLVGNLTFYQLAVFSPPGDLLAPLTISSSVNVFFFETSIRRSLQMAPSDSDNGPIIANSDIVGDVLAGVTESGSAELSVVGGQLRGLANVRGVMFSGDVILGASCVVEGGGYDAVFIDSGKAIHLTDATMFPGNAAGFATTVIWGPGALEVDGNARLEYFPGANQAQAIFRNTGGLLINGATSACAVDTAAVGNWRCGIPITAANLDAPVSGGGFGGTAVNPGGASISNLEGF